MSDTNRAKAVFQQLRKHGTDLDLRKTGDLPGVIMDDEASDGESIADRELKRMVRADVFRSNPTTIKQDNSEPRRYGLDGNRKGRKYKP